MKLTVISLLILLFTISFVSGLSITEVELNPAGDDSGYEWVELYSEESVNLGDYILKNNDGQMFNLSGNIQGYKQIIFPKQFLDNSNESVSILKSGSTVDETDIFKDDKNNELTWSLCEGDWKLISETPHEENTCGSQDSSPPSPSLESSSQASTTPEISEAPPSQAQTITNKQQKSQIAQPEEKIILTSKNKKTAEKPSEEYITSQGFSQVWLPYAFSFICIVIILFLVIKKL